MSLALASMALASAQSPISVYGREGLFGGQVLSYLHRVMLRDCCPRKKDRVSGCDYCDGEEGRKTVRTAADPAFKISPMAHRYFTLGERAVCSRVFNRYTIGIIHLSTKCILEE